MLSEEMSSFELTAWQAFCRVRNRRLKERPAVPDDDEVIEHDGRGGFAALAAVMGNAEAIVTPEPVDDDDDDED